MKPSERADMARQLAGRLQVGRFQSLMEGYVDAQKLAVDTQLRLNAAQEANARILGTLKGQLTALRVEWDRMAMTAGLSFGPQAAEWVRMAKNVMRGWNDSGPEPRSYPPGLGPDGFGMRGMVPDEVAREHARGWLKSRIQQTGAVPTFWQTVWTKERHDEATAIWQQERLKLLHETPYERGEEAFQNKVQELHGRAQSAAMKARLFETVKAALPGAMAVNPEMAHSMQTAAASEMSLKDAQAFRGMAAAGDKAGMSAMLTAQAKKARQESMQAATAELAERDAQTAKARRAIEETDKQIQQATAEGRDTSSLVAQRANLTRAIDENTEARTRALAVIEEELGKTEQALWIKQKYVDLLKQQEMVMQGLSQLGEQGNPDTIGTRLDSQVGVLKDQVALLEAQRDRSGATRPRRGDARGRAGEGRRPEGADGEAGATGRAGLAAAPHDGRDL